MNQQKAINDLCARMFLEPERLVSVFAARLHAPLCLPVHQHHDQLQLDMAVGCSGNWPGAKAAVVPSGVTAVVFYPRAPHGYELIPTTQSAAAFSLKLRVEPSWPAVKGRVLPRIVTDCTAEAPLLRALWKLKRLHDRHSLASLTAAALSEVLCLWPGESSGSIAADRDVNDPVVAEALRLIDGTRGDPPSVEDLATAVHLSPRQFSRRMRAHFGCSAKACISARRLGRARALLGAGQLSITETAETLRFASIHTFSRWFRRQTGIAPSQWRAQPGL